MSKPKKKIPPKINQICRKCSTPHNSKKEICVRCNLKTNLQKLIEKKLLPEEIVPKLFEYLELPSRIEELSFRQVQMVERHLEKIRAKTFALSRLESGEVRVSKAASESPKPQTRQHQPAKTKPRWKGMRNENYRKLQKRERNRCYWCGVEVIKIAEVPLQNRIKINRFTLVYADKKGIIEKPIATVDHLVRHSDGGSAKLSNTVLSCSECNFKRGIEANQTDWQTCRLCGKKYDDLENLKCLACFKNLSLSKVSFQISEKKSQNENLSSWQKLKRMFSKYLRFFSRGGK